MFQNFPFKTQKTKNSDTYSYGEKEAMRTCVSSSSFFAFAAAATALNVGYWMVVGPASTKDKNIKGGKDEDRFTSLLDSPRGECNGSTCREK